MHIRVPADEPVSLGLGPVDRVVSSQPGIERVRVRKKLGGEQVKAIGGGCDFNHVRSAIGTYRPSQGGPATGTQTPEGLHTS